MESYNIEYKVDIGSKPKNDCYSFIKDVVAFLNSDGGKIIFGANGKPLKHIEFKNNEIDNKQEQIQNIILDANFKSRDITNREHDISKESRYISKKSHDTNEQLLRMNEENIDLLKRSIVKYGEENELVQISNIEKIFSLNKCTAQRYLKELYEENKIDKKKEKNYYIYYKK